MHSRIFQVRETPIARGDYIGECDCYEYGFLHSIADYVDENTNRSNDIQWLKCCYENNGLSFGIDDDGEYFIVEDKAKFFESKFEQFQKTLKELSEKTFENFISGDCGFILCSLKSSYEDKFGFYVECEDYGLETFDMFMRYATIGTKYYIGATIDYHC